MTSRFAETRVLFGHNELWGRPSATSCRHISSVKGRTRSVQRCQPHRGNLHKHYDGDTELQTSGDGGWGGRRPARPGGLGG